MHQFPIGVDGSRAVGLPAICDTTKPHYILTAMIEDPETTSLRLIPASETPNDDALFIEFKWDIQFR